MSLDAMKWVLYEIKVPVPGGQLKTLLALADYADPDGRDVFPSVRTLASRLHVSERSVQRHLRALESSGLIRRGAQERVAYMPADARPVVYDLAMTATRGDRSDPHALAERGDNPGTESGGGVTTLADGGDNSGGFGVTPGVTQSKNLTPIEPFKPVPDVTTDARADQPEQPPCGQRDRDRPARKPDEPSSAYGSAPVHDPNVDPVLAAAIGRVRAKPAPQACTSCGGPLTRTGRCPPCFDAAACRRREPPPSSRPPTLQEA